jgi:hypothetical protein
MVNGREHRPEEKACQDNMLVSQPRDEERVLFTNGEQPRRGMEAYRRLMNRKSQIYHNDGGHLFAVCSLPHARVSWLHSPPRYTMF